MTLRPIASVVVAALLAVALESQAAGAATSQAERAFARTIAPLSANDVTGDLIGNIGRHVAFVCTVTAIVHADTMIGQCGAPSEPVDMYVLTPTAKLHVGTRLRVMGEMLTPSQWVDVTGHSWFTAMLKAEYADRL